MEGVLSPVGDGVGAALIRLHLVGRLRAATAASGDILPPLRKARAMFVVVALSEGQTIRRRHLAQLLWSRNDQAQALARLRDSLRTLRQSMRDALGNDTDILELDGDRVALRPGSVVAVIEGGGADRPRGSELAADLDGIDPALDEWLRGLRMRYRGANGPAAASPPSAEPSPPAKTPKRGSVVGMSLLEPIGPQIDDYLPRALTEEVATALSRVRGLVVVSTGSVAAAMAGQRSLSADLGLDFLLEGSLQCVRDRLRIVFKLLDAANGVVCWTAHFTYDPTDLFHVQQDVANLVSAALEPELPTIAAERSKRVGAAEGAYELVLRAVGRIHLLDRRSFIEAGDLLNRAIDLDPEYSLPYSWLAYWLMFLVGQGWASDPRASIQRAGEVAEHAVLLDPSDARGLTIAGHVRAFLHRRLDEAIALHERALSVNPSLPLAWHFSGVAQAYKGNLLEARYRIEQCRRLAPRDPHSFYAEGAVIIVELLTRNYEQAVSIGRRVTQLHPRFSAAYKPYLSALGHLGLHREAALVRRRLLELEPDFCVRGFRASSPFATAELNDHYVAGLNLAGVT